MVAVSVPELPDLPIAEIIRIPLRPGLVVLFEDDGVGFSAYEVTEGLGLLRISVDNLAAAAEAGVRQVVVG